MNTNETPDDLRAVLHLLEQGRARLQKYGWCQGRLGNGSTLGQSTEFCLAGSLLAGPGADLSGKLAYREDVIDACGDEFQRMYQRALRRFSAVVGTKFPAMWNDRAGRTKAEVIAAFDSAIAQLKAELNIVSPRAIDQLAEVHA